MEVNPTAQPFSDSNRIGVELQITDARVAHTSLDLAESTRNPEDKARRINEAHKAYESVLHFLVRLSPTDQQRVVLSDLLSTLKTRLEAEDLVF